MTSVAKIDPSDRPMIFVSYPRIDDTPPPDKPKNQGFVRWFYDLLRHELSQRGLPDGGVWIDRFQIEPAEDFTEVIKDALEKSDLLLVILSRNYLKSEFCAKEIDTFVEHLNSLPEKDRKRRIFRVDKGEVLDRELPAVLKGVHAIRFFEKDPETGKDYPFYDGRKVRTKKYVPEIETLAYSIFKRLQELGDGIGSDGPVKPPPQPQGPTKACVYVAKPAFDMNDEYQTLVRELEGRRYAVVPNPDQDLPNDGVAAMRIVREALAQSTLSIHLVGEKRGFKPDGLDDGIVGFQLAEAKARAERSDKFPRLIWIPKLFRQSDGESSAPRDPVKVLEQFGPLLKFDDIESDAGARFNEFVLQRLDDLVKVRPSNPPDLTVAKKPDVFVGALSIDLAHGVSMVQRIKETGGNPTLVPLNPGATAGNERMAAMLERADHAVFCWGQADEASVFDALASPVLENWRAKRSKGRVCLAIFVPDSDMKSAALISGSFGAADIVVDASDGELGMKLQPLVASKP